MTTQTVEQELLELEQEYWQAVKDKNTDGVTRLSDEPCFITGAQGVRRVSRQELTGLTKSTSYTLHDFRISDAQVRLLRDDVAVVVYNVHEKLTVEGKPVSMDAADASTWIRRDGRWVCALHTESVKGDPFGRDRAQ